jgi:peptidoglycan/LPS O-acetylase OafA/YrhL
MNESRRHLLALTGIRFFAAFHVVLYHAMPKRPLPWLVSGVLNTGYVAVNLFFMLSGFILAYTYGDKPSPRPFWNARFARIYPVYCVGLILAAPFVVKTHLAHHAYAGLLTEGVLSVSLLQAHLPEYALAWNGPGWSLSAEAFFYAMFPFLAPRLLNLSSRSARWTAMAVWLIAMFVAGSYDVQAVVDSTRDHTDQIGGWEAFLRYNPVVRLPDFALGILLARSFLRGEFDRIRPFASTLTLSSVVCVIGGLAMSERIPTMMLHNGLLAPFFAVLIIGLAFGGGLVGRLLSLPVLVLLGEASYALYILHIPIYEIVTATIKRVSPAHLTDLRFLLAYAVVSVMASVLVFQKFEVPMRARVRSWLSL